MNTGRHHRLYLMPFDHRRSYITGMFDFSLPLSTAQHHAVAHSKQLIYEGFKQALVNGVPKEYAGILVDEEFGADILRDASAQGYTTALAVEKSGSDEFQFEYGARFGEHITKFNPTFVKVLVRYNPEDDSELNHRQIIQLKTLSDYCRSTQRLFMFELLVPATTAQMTQAQNDKDVYDSQVRPGLMLQVIACLQDGGVEPDIWKIEGLDLRRDCERVIEMARRGGRTHVDCIVLGRGADEKKVADWISVAAAVPGFIGFAVGRTTFWDAVRDYESGSITARAASARIAARYQEWVRIFEQQRPLRSAINQ